MLCVLKSLSTSGFIRHLPGENGCMRSTQTGKHPMQNSALQLLRLDQNCLERNWILCTTTFQEPNPNSMRVDSLVPIEKLPVQRWCKRAPKYRKPCRKLYFARRVVWTFNHHGEDPQTFSNNLSWAKLNCHISRNFLQIWIQLFLLVCQHSVLLKYSTIESRTKMKPMKSNWQWESKIFTMTSAFQK